MDPHFTNILQCPLTHRDLTWLDAGQVAQLNAEISRGGLFHLDGTPIRKPLCQAFASADGKLIYPVEEDIVILLPFLAMTGDPETARTYGQKLRVEKQAIMDFYDQVGWKEEGDQFYDGARFEDLRPVTRDYIHHCHMRVNRYLSGQGTYLLDAASGPVQYPEYLIYSEGYEYRVCADISFRALKQAKKNVGGKGIYLLCDVTDLPLKDNTMDGIVSLHTIYHVPADEQAGAVRELHRTLKAGRSGVVVYGWGPHSFLMNLLMVPYFLLKRLLRKGAEAETSELYFHHHKPAWFRKEIKRQCRARLAVWRSVSVAFLRRVIHEKAFGRQLLAIIFALENALPGFFGKVGAYPMFILTKPEE
jgi:SAM-dependent methyltransferase/uncharacterized protein YbaR (Trm112 family)